jgi:hypothetical protein
MSKPIDYGQQELGWISIQDVKNVFHEQLRNFDVQVWPAGTTGQRTYVQKFVDSLQHELYRRAKAHYQAFLIAQGPPSGKAPAPDSRETHQKRVETMQSRRG